MKPRRNRPVPEIMETLIAAKLQENVNKKATISQVQVVGTDHRKRLAPERKSISRKFRLPRDADGRELKMHVTVGLYEDGTPGEIFIRTDKAGSFESGILDGFAIMASLALQHGASLKTIVNQLIATRFEPAGMTGDKDFPMVTSPLDYIGRWLKERFNA